ncbi:MAG: NAD(P)/FAD-dependent oxidoreductase [Gammaproteobacteria bacterium]|nr:NAD(P)/FAD-dependent oxidoreductase [Gammaproteobacteria bacterium]
MQSYDVLIVGGGPAGSACARKLVQAGRRVAVLDRERFPRTKLCAGWVTPEAVADLDLDVDAYPHRFNTFEHIVVHIKGLTFKLDTPQHSIRRFEFDHFLLERSGADFFVHNVKTIERDGGDYVVDEAFRAPYLVGAGGTRCPVYRDLFREANPRARELQAATYEHEFPFEWHDADCHLWFFDKGLPGYAWYVPKADGYLNCGIGGMAEKLKANGDDIKKHWRHFTGVLSKRGLVEGFEYAPKGYSYFLRGNVDVVRIDNAFIAGDAVGLATVDLCEGIGPAIRSGHLAAESILSGREYSLQGIAAHSSEHALVRKLLEYMFVKRKSRAVKPRASKSTSSTGARQQTH